MSSLKKIIWMLMTKRDWKQFRRSWILSGIWKRPKPNKDPEIEILLKVTKILPISRLLPIRGRERKRFLSSMVPKAK